MKVKCISNKRADLSIINSLSVEKEYEVIAISFNVYRGKLDYNLLDDFERLAFYDKKYFAVTDDKLDLDWVFRQVTEDDILLLPKVMSYKTFYEDYHNDDEVAISIFKKRFLS